MDGCIGGQETRFWSGPGAVGGDDVEGREGRGRVAGVVGRAGTTSTLRYDMKPRESVVATTGQT